ncbi:NAD(P)-binding domain-containing protein [Natrarchaeobius halalkaliphilus]|nr:NAD(P)-binding domain-containing protein [Natrarchaeobius halalkaliphilus]
MNDVSVIGCGGIGTAFVETLAGEGVNVIAWNRTREKAEALAGKQVEVADSPGDALEASRTTLCCVSDHPTMMDILEDASDRIDGTTIIGVSFATPEQATEANAFMQDFDGHYLDMAVLAYPRLVGTDTGHFFIAGDSRAYEAARSILDHLGTVTYIDGPPGSAFLRESVVFLPFLPMAVSMVQSAHIAEAMDIPLAWVGERFRALYPAFIDITFETIQSGMDPADPANVDASVQVWSAGAEEYACFLDEMGLDTGMYEALHRLFEAGVADGRGDHDWVSVTELRADQPSS